MVYFFSYYMCRWMYEFKIARITRNVCMMKVII